MWRELVVLVVIYLLYRYIYDGTYYYKSSLDNNEYKVRFGADSSKKANLLAMINKKYSILLDALRNDQGYKNNIPVQRLLKKWDSGLTIKETGIMESDAAYVINKKYLSFNTLLKINYTILPLAYL